MFSKQLNGKCQINAGNKVNLKNSVSFLIASMVVTSLLFAGCSQSQQEIQDEPVAVKAAITTDCIVHYYKSDASAYVDECLIFLMCNCMT